MLVKTSYHTPFKYYQSSYNDTYILTLTPIFYLKNPNINVE